MPHTAIITDTDASLPFDLAKKFNIVQVPIAIQFGDESLNDVYDIDATKLFHRIDKENKLPTTAALLQVNLWMPTNKHLIQVQMISFASQSAAR